MAGAGARSGRTNPKAGCLGVGSDIELVLLALRQGILDEDASSATAG